VGVLPQIDARPHPGVLRTPTLPTISALIAASTILVLALMLAR